MSSLIKRCEVCDYEYSASLERCPECKVKNRYVVQSSYKRVMLNPYSRSVRVMINPIAGRIMSVFVFMYLALWSIFQPIKAMIYLKLWLEEVFVEVNSSEEDTDETSTV